MRFHLGILAEAGHKYVVCHKKYGGAMRMNFIYNLLPAEPGEKMKLTVIFLSVTLTPLSIAQTDTSVVVSGTLRTVSARLTLVASTILFIKVVKIITLRNFEVIKVFMQESILIIKL